jgi:biopolymer transport protein ExbB/TolQ
MSEQELAEIFVPRPEFQMYCRSVNGDLADIKQSMGDLSKTLENRHQETRDDIRLTFANTERALATSNANIEKALAAANKNMEKALEGTMSKSYAIIITIITGACMGLLGSVITLIATRGNIH